MSQDQFYLYIERDNVGTNACFHGIHGNGYVTNLDEAEIYTHAEMQKIVTDGHLRKYEGELPLSVSHVNTLARWHVDCQCVDYTQQYPNFIDPKDEYVAVRKDKWDGNDLGFASNLSYTYDYGNARVFNANKVKALSDPDYYFIAKTITDEVARRTFAWADISRRKMIQGAGIVGVRKPRKSCSSGKVRMNCPCCGKIHWQLNPYDFDSCNDISCDAHKLNNPHLYRY